MKRILVVLLLCLYCFSGYSQLIKVTADTIVAQAISILPEDIRGNWFRTDGSGDWAYGFHDKVAICEGEVYDVTGVAQVNRRYRIQIRNQDHEKTLFVKLVLKGNLKIGADPDKTDLFSPQPVVKPDYVIPNDVEFQSPVLKRDTATVWASPASFSGTRQISISVLGSFRFQARYGQSSEAAVYG